MGPHRGRGASGRSPPSLPSKTDPPSFGEARTEPRPHRVPLPATARRHRTPPAAARGDQPLPAHPHPFHEHQSTHRVTEHTRWCSLGRASSSPASSSSSELAGLRLPCSSVPDCGGPPVSCQARAGALSRPRARESWAASSGPAQSSEMKFVFIILSLIFVQVGKI
jgi:hypothetical protein